MGKKYIKIQNLLFPRTKELDQHWWLFYRGNRFFYNKQESARQLRKGEYAEFFTYFNAFSIEKWKKYTCLDRIFLRLRVSGNFSVQTFGHYMVGNEIKKEFYDDLHFDLKERREVMVPFPKDAKAQVFGFVISATDTFSLYGGEYVSLVDDTQIRDINISLVTVTFKKEDFITRNLKLLENEIFYADEELARHLYVRVIDNGRTLSEEEWNSDYIHIYPNPNVGGSGGYTRGMMESLEDMEHVPTHVLLMDDDVMILPESFIRTFSMLRLMKDEYRNHFISGAMLFYEHLNVQHEDVGYVHEDGSYGPRKPRMEMHLWDSVIRNEKIYEDKPNMYAGWWYCCVPVSMMNMDNLPIPLFIRGDDVEFSIARQAKFITLNGICVWHMGFSAKYNPAMELYQVHRNSLIIQATSDVTPEIDFIDRIKEFFWIELKRFNYVSCDLLLDSIADFMKGPEFLKTPEGEHIMKRQGARQRPMKALAEEYPEIPVDLGHIYVHDKPLSSWKQFWYDVTFNGQLLPTWMLDRKPGVIAYDWFDAPEKQYLKESVLAVCPMNATGDLRYRSRREFLRLIKRYRAVMKDYKANAGKVRAAYKASRNEITSSGFWKGYLENDTQ
mgnify:FL=1